MTPASLIAEAVRNQEPIQSTRDRVAAAAHVARHYRAIAMPALAAAAQRISNRRRKAKAAICEIGYRLAET